MRRLNDSYKMVWGVALLIFVAVGCQRFERQAAISPIMPSAANVYPIAVPLNPPAKRVTAGQDHSCAILNDETLWCWGNNNVGQLGNAMAGRSSANPVQVGTFSAVGASKDNTFAPLTRVQNVIAAKGSGGGYTCAVYRVTDSNTQSDNLQVACWGSNFGCQLGMNSGCTVAAAPSAPMPNPPLPGPMTPPDAAPLAPKALPPAPPPKLVMAPMPNNKKTTTKDGLLSFSAKPLVITADANGSPLVINDASKIYANYDRVCVSDKNTQTPFCWGLYMSLDIQNAATTTSAATYEPKRHKSPIPTGIDPNSIVNWVGFQDFAILNNDACALTVNSYNCLGNQTAVSDQAGITALIADDRQVCYRSGDPQLAVYCNSAIVMSFDAAVDKMTSLSKHTCALISNGEAWCWGKDSYGQLGVGYVNDNDSGPQQVGNLPPVSDLSAGDQHTCAVGQDGSVWCWGNNASGQVGPNGLK